MLVRGQAATPANVYLVSGPKSGGQTSVWRAHLRWGQTPNLVQRRTKLGMCSQWMGEGTSGGQTAAFFVGVGRGGRDQAKIITLIGVDLPSVAD
jgi:hypothetical protein